MMVNPVETNANNLYNTTTQMCYSSVLPLSGGVGGATPENMLLPAAYNSIMDNSFPQKNSMKSDSGLTYNVPLSTKACNTRENSTSINNFPFPSYPSSRTTATAAVNKSCASSSFSFLGEDISLQIHQQQVDIDNLIAQRMEKVRMEVDEKRKRQAKRLIEAVEIGVMKKLKSKQEEIEKIGKLNWALGERVKSLCIENQIWRDLAQTNEATANALRSNLEQVLAQRDGGGGGATVSPAGAMVDDAESCCGSTDGDDEGWRTLAGECAGVKDKDSGSRLCRNCGKDESCVLILPCRHLCLCTVCGSTLHTCPICKSFKTASVHVNMF